MEGVQEGGRGGAGGRCRREVEGCAGGVKGEESQAK